MINRRDVLVLSVGALAAARLRPARAQQQAAERHGMSAFGDLALPPDFKHFGYVNPDAPKGGKYSESVSTRGYNGSFLTFDSLNAYILKGTGAFGMDYTFATLMTANADEPDAMYGFAARAVRVAPDGLTYTFPMRPEAKFHDGTPLTAADVAWSINTLKANGHPIIAQLLRDCKGAEVEADAVVVRFAPKRARDVPLFVAGLPIFSKTYYSQRDFDQSTLDAPLGSGVYKVGRFEPGRFIEFSRVKDWWGADLPVMRGLYNFDVIRYEYYRDRDVGFEGFTAGDYLFREEATSRTWATRYNFPAFNDGRVKRRVIPDHTPSGAQGWFMNTRRDKFKDRRLREALIDAFDFEWTNRTIMYGSYERTKSVFENSPMKAVGPPSPEEVTLLEPFRGKVPDEVFGQPYVPPVTDGSGQDRRWLHQAAALLTEAGCTIKDGKRVLPSGEPISIEFLIDEPNLQPHHLPLIRNLGILGIQASLRLVDPVQYRRRVDDFDFDVIIDRFSFSLTPGESLRTYFSSQAAGIKGSQNHAGIADPAIDAMIDHIIAADTREQMTVAARALDRVFRAGRYWIPHWYKPNYWLAYWDVFAWPDKQPRYGRGVPETWWADSAKAAAMKKG